MTGFYETVRNNERVEELISSHEEICQNYLILCFDDEIGSMWVQVLCLRLVEGRVLDLEISDEGVRLAEDGLLLFSLLFVWVLVFYLCEECANPKFIMPSNNFMNSIT